MLRILRSSPRMLAVFLLAALVLTPGSAGATAPATDPVAMSFPSSHMGTFFHFTIAARTPAPRCEAPAMMVRSGTPSAFHTNWTRCAAVRT